MSISSRRILQALPFRKIEMYEKQQSRFTLWLNAIKNTQDLKNVSSKSCCKLNFVQKSQWVHMFIFPRSGARRGSKQCHFRNIEMYKKRQSRLTLKLRLVKNTHYVKNASNKSCCELNFVQKSQQAHMCIFPRSVARGLQRLPSLKYYNVQKGESGLTLGLNNDKNTHYVKKCFK